MGKVACRSERARIRVRIRGIVQGVGFRPFVYRLAVQRDLSGGVWNDEEGVVVEVEGDPLVLYDFVKELAGSPPPAARVDEVHVESVPPEGEDRFRVLPSRRKGSRDTLVAADLATCPQCLEEMSSPTERRYRYPFTNCTACGPRYTIVIDVPYDRERTTMRSFPMCPSCRREYEDVSDRRFHAEPVCCPTCGPRVWLTDRHGNPVVGETGEAIEGAVHLLERGHIVAVKGLGGFHIACDASNEEAVTLLRRRKLREAKPLAVMVADLQAAERIAHVEPEEKKHLLSPARPIVLLKKRADSPLSDSGSPGVDTVGVVLPYTPLHHLLMEGGYPALVMTSGNLTDEPMVFRNEDAVRRLGGVVDFFLMHDRDIHVRNDDSVMKVVNGKSIFLRRSRGYVPLPIDLPVDVPCSMVAAGGDLKNTLCITRGNQAFLSQHIGDLSHAQAFEAFTETLEHLQRLLGVEVETSVCDMHPAYVSSSFFRRRYPAVVEVQHHHAHIASVMAEWGLSPATRLLGVAMDGTGWGDDGTVWGGEFLLCNGSGYRRVGRLRRVPLPGGDAAARSPARMGYVFLLEAFGDDADAAARRCGLPLGEEERRMLRAMVERGVNTPYTSSAGRLFDAAAAVAGICTDNTYEAQAPMMLEALCSNAEEEVPYDVPVSRNGGVWEVDGVTLLKNVFEDVLAGVDVHRVASRFHDGFADAVCRVCIEVAGEYGIDTVALSGGVFANGRLLSRVIELLSHHGLRVLCNRLVPPGDGGLSLGQAFIAAGRLQCA